MLKNRERLFQMDTVKKKKNFQNYIEHGGRSEK